MRYAAATKVKRKAADGLFTKPSILLRGTPTVYRKGILP
jgi:hypothetical protein